jgi:hypothetical protein
LHARTHARTHAQLAFLFVVAGNLSCTGPDETAADRNAPTSTRAELVGPWLQSDTLYWDANDPLLEVNTLVGALSSVLGLTCDEVFATAYFPDDQSTIVRIRLDSLGPGIPPD